MSQHRTWTALDRRVALSCQIPPSLDASALGKASGHGRALAAVLNERKANVSTKSNHLGIANKASSLAVLIPVGGVALDLHTKRLRDLLTKTIRPLGARSTDKSNVLKWHAHCGPQKRVNNLTLIMPCP